MNQLVAAANRETARRSIDVARDLMKGLAAPSRSGWDLLKRLCAGAGNFTATDIANRNGETGREAISGTYSVSPDCTFTEIEYTSDGTVYHSAGIPRNYPIIQSPRWARWRPRFSRRVAPAYSR
jgi:hypothetical protein